MKPNLFITISFGLVVGVAGLNSVHAQVTTKPVLTLDGAKQVIAGAVAEARAKHAPGGVIAVVDDGGNLMALERLDGTFSAGANIAIGKARTAALFKKPTKVFEDIVNKGRTTMVALQDFTPLQGGIPIDLNNAVVGAVGVSGAASAQQDEDLAVAGVKALMTLAMNESAASTQESMVTYIPTDKVAEAFNKGAVLVGEDERMMHAHRNYMVHASHRDKPGMAEIHELDTDIMYVLKGSATLVTGGTAIEANPTGPHELRGSHIEGGESRQIVPGDIVIIPNGVPHWFKEVQAPFNYYVVKVR